jgi:hypothetical protein
MCCTHLQKLREYCHDSVDAVGEIQNISKSRLAAIQVALIKQQIATTGVPQFILHNFNCYISHETLITD